MPSMIPIIVRNGLVLYVRSAHTPATARPTIGINIRQVVSPAMPINKTTVEVERCGSGGVGLSSLFFIGDALIYVYTVTEKVLFANATSQ